MTFLVLGGRCTNLNMLEVTCITPRTACLGITQLARTSVFELALITLFTLTARKLFAQRSVSTFVTFSLLTLPEPLLRLDRELAPLLCKLL